MTIPRAFREFFESLNAHHVEYAVVGGYAVAFHGAPRFTGVIDILVSSTSANAKSILSTLSDSGFGDSDLTPADFQKPDRVVQFGVPPLRIDLLTSIDGVSWERVREHRIASRLDETTVYFIGRDELIDTKRATGRAKDIADLEALGVT